jgi:hypothetical protein
MATRSEDWTKEGGQYIPYPATWLNAKGWEDEYSPMPTKFSGIKQWLNDKQEEPLEQDRLG